MAKRGRPAAERPAAGAEAGSGKSAASTTEQMLGDFAEDLGGLLGQAQAKAGAWLEQRRTIAERLTNIRDTANEYLKQLTGSGAAMAGAVVRARRGRPPGGGATRGPGRPKGSGRKKRTMSPEARAKIAAAQKARWARQKAGKKS